MNSLTNHKLGDLIREAKPGFACGREDPHGIFQIRMNNITRDGKLTTEKRRLIPRDTKQIPESQLQKGDVLFNATNSPEMVGKTTLIEDLEELTVYSNHFIRLRSHTDILLPSYLARWLNFMFQRGTFRSMCRQWVNQATLSRKDLLNLSILLPKITQQAEATALMNAVNDAQDKRRRSIELLDELVQSVFLDMFGDTAKGDKDHLGEYLDFLTSGSRGWAKHYTDQPGDLFLRIQNVRKNELDLADVAYVNPPETAEARRTLAQPGDVLLSITADLGRTAVVPEGLGKAFINQHLSILRTSKLNPVYLSAYLSSEYGQRQIMKKNRTGVKSGLNFDDIRSLEIPVPPLSLQEDFANRLESVRQLKTKHQAHLSYLDELFASVQQRAFDGTLWDDPGVAA